MVLVGSDDVPAGVPRGYVLDDVGEDDLEKQHKQLRGRLEHLHLDFSGFGWDELST